MMLEKTPEVEEAHARIPGDGETAESTPDLQDPAEEGCVELMLIGGDGGR
jgi:hypothetical protein